MYGCGLSRIWQSTAVDFVATTVRATAKGLACIATEAMEPTIPRVFRPTYPARYAHVFLCVYA